MAGSAACVHSSSAAVTWCPSQSLCIKSNRVHRPLLSKASRSSQQSMHVVSLLCVPC
jgi:hypothetical protein